MLSGFRSISFKSRCNSQAPNNLSRTRYARLAFHQSLPGAGDVVLSKLNQCEREIVLIVVWITSDGIAVNLFRTGGVAQMPVDIPEQSQIGIVFAPLL